MSLSNGAVIQSFLLRDLESVRQEVSRYPREEDLWVLPPGLPNSGGNLALHLAGNIQYYIGAVLGSTGYVRDRPREFSARDVPRSEILEELEHAIRAVEEILPSLGEEELQSDFPGDPSGIKIRTNEYLIQLAVHLAYHLGQLSYHRRMVTGQREGVGAIATADLSIARSA